LSTTLSIGRSGSRGRSGGAGGSSCCFSSSRAEAIVDGTSGCRSTYVSASSSRSQGRAGRSDIDSNRVLCSARMVLSTSSLAVVVVAAISDALLTPFLADVVGEGLRIFGSVWGLAVFADAGVRECGLPTCQREFIPTTGLHSQGHRYWQRSLTTIPAAAGRGGGKLPLGTCTISL
jgi:hypothetical protein